MSRYRINSNQMYVAANKRAQFEALFVAANPEGTAYFIGTNFTIAYPVVEGVTIDVPYDTMVFLDGEEPLVIHRGKKNKRGFGGGGTPVQIATYQTAMDSNTLLVGNAPVPQPGTVFNIQTNYSDLTQETILDSLWGNIKVLDYPSSDNLTKLAEVGLDITAISLVPSFMYQVEYLGMDEGNNHLVLLLNKSGMEKTTLELIDPKNLTGEQKLAIYLYLAEINKTGKRISNSLGIDYVIVVNGIEDEDLLYKITVKYIGSGLKEDYFEAREHNGETLFTPRELLKLNIRDLNDTLDGLHNEVDSLNNSIHSQTDSINNLQGTTNSLQSQIIDLKGGSTGLNVTQVPFAFDLPKLLTEQPSSLYMTKYGIEDDRGDLFYWPNSDDESPDSVYHSPFRLLDSVINHIPMYKAKAFSWQKFTLSYKGESIFRVILDGANRSLDDNVLLFISDYNFEEGNVIRGRDLYGYLTRISESPEDPSLDESLRDSTPLTPWLKLPKTLYVYVGIFGTQEASWPNYQAYVAELKEQHRLYTYVPAVEPTTGDIVELNTFTDNSQRWKWLKVPGHPDRAALFDCTNQQWENLDYPTGAELSSSELENYILEYFNDPEHLEDLTKEVKYIPKEILRQPQEYTPDEYFWSSGVEVYKPEKYTLSFNPIDMGYDYPRDHGMLPGQWYKTNGYTNYFNSGEIIGLAHYGSDNNGYYSLAFFGLDGLEDLHISKGILRFNLKIIKDTMEGENRDGSRAIEEIVNNFSSNPGNPLLNGVYMMVVSGNMSTIEGAYDQEYYSENHVYNLRVDDPTLSQQSRIIQPSEVTSSEILFNVSPEEPINGRVIIVLNSEVLAGFMSDLVDQSELQEGDYLGFSNVTSKTTIYDLPQYHFKGFPTWLNLLGNKQHIDDSSREITIQASNYTDIYIDGSMHNVVLNTSTGDTYLDTSNITTLTFKVSASKELLVINSHPESPKILVNLQVSINGSSYWYGISKFEVNSGNNSLYMEVIDVSSVGPGRSFEIPGYITRGFWEDNLSNLLEYPRSEHFHLVTPEWLDSINTRITALENQNNNQS